MPTAIGGWNDLPCELILHILDWINVDDLLKLLTVSHKLRSLSAQTLYKITTLDVKTPSRFVNKPREEKELNLHGGGSHNAIFIRLTTLIPWLKSLHISPSVITYDLPDILHTIGESYWWSNLCSLSVTCFSSFAIRALAGLPNLNKLSLNGMIEEDCEVDLHETLQCLVNLQDVSIFVQIRVNTGVQRYCTEFVKHLSLYQLRILGCPVDASTLMQILLCRPLTELQELSVKLLGVLNLNLDYFVPKLPSLTSLDISFEGNTPGRVNDLHFLTILKLKHVQIRNAILRRGVLRCKIAPRISLDRVRLTRRLCRYLLYYYNCSCGSGGQKLDRSYELCIELKYLHVNLVDKLNDLKVAGKFV